jgi:divalent metal cation (Fe/Co/Zn/Cd) transporter
LALVTTSPRQDRLRSRGVRLEWLTNAWNAMEVIVTVTLGWRARSLGLVAFGLDSLVEIFASTVVIRNLQDERDDPGDRRIHRALRLIALAFWVLAAFLLVTSTRSLALGSRPDHSPFGVAFLGVTAVVMFGLATLKRRTGWAVDSETLRAEATMTMLDGCLATAVLVSLVLNARLGWWWTDATAALVVAAFAVYEGLDQWRDAAPHADDEPRAEAAA